MTKGKKISESEQHTLTYLVSHTDKIEGVPLRKIAQELYTSPATLVRLAQKLGFSGYLELLYFLKNRLNRQMTTEAAINYQINTEGIAASIDAIKEIYAQNNDKFITIYANGFSGIIAEYLHKKMLVNGIKTLLVSASDSGGIISNNIDNISMLITISKSGETQKVLEKMQLANDHQIPTVLFCGNGEHRAHQLANFYGKLLLLMEYLVEAFTAEIN